MNRLAQRLPVRLAIFVILATVLVWTMLPTVGWVNEFRDAQVLTLHERVAALTVRRFGQVPLWNPWYCGGLYGLGEPQSRFAAPPFLLSLVFGVTRAEPLVIFLFTVLGMEGTYRWVRLRVDDAFAALRVAPVFALSGHFAVAYFSGWTNFFGFALLPFILYGVNVAARGRVLLGITTSSVAFAVMLGFGGTFAAPIVAVAMTIEGVRVLTEERPSTRLRAVAALLAVASFMFTLSALRLLPLAETLAAQPRIMAGTPGHSPKAIWAYLAQPLAVKDGNVLDAGSFYVGVTFLVLVALGGSDRKSLRPLLALIVLLWFTAGYARKPPLFALLRELPVFSGLRYPERFLWVAVLYACEPAASALARIPYLGDGKRWRQGATVVLTLAVVVTVGLELSAFVSAGNGRLLGVVAEDAGADLSAFRQSRGNRWIAAHHDAIGTGSLSCWETHPIAMSPKLRGDLAAEEYLADARTGRVRRLSWSPNVVVVHASMATPGRLFVNQNWHPGWRASVGRVVSDDGLLAVDLPVGEHDVTLAFRPRSAIAGGLVTLTAGAALLGLMVHARRRRGHLFGRASLPVTTSLVLLPWAVFLLLVVTWDEPRFPPPALRNANGAPAIAAEVPADAQRIDARFGVPVIVEAAKLEGPDTLGNVTLDVYLRRSAPLPRTTAMFVHVLRREGQEATTKTADGKDPPPTYLNGDHQVVGGSFYLSDAPLGRLVDDAFGLHVGKLAPGAYDLWVGFGHVSARKGRSPVIDAGAATVNESRIRVGSFVLP